MDNKFYNIAERIAFIAQNENISIRAIETMAGTSNGVLNKIVKNGGDLKCSLASKLLELFPQYSAEWFVCGTGEPLKKDHDPGAEPVEPVVSALFQRIDQQAVENARLNERIDQLLKQNYQKHKNPQIAAEPEHENSDKNK